VKVLYSSRHSLHHLELIEPIVCVGKWLQKGTEMHRLDIDYATSPGRLIPSYPRAFHLLTIRSIASGECIPASVPGPQRITESSHPTIKR